MHATRWILAAAILCGSSAWAAAYRPAGIDLSGIDHGVKPGGDFFRHANGWLKTAKIPADRSGTGVFSRCSNNRSSNNRRRTPPR